MYFFYSSFFALDSRKTFEEETNRSFASRGRKKKKKKHSIVSFNRLEGTGRNKKVTEKGVGDKGDVGRRDVRQAAPVGPPNQPLPPSSSIFLFSPLFPNLFLSLSLFLLRSIGYEERIFHLLLSTFLSCLSAETSEMLLSGSRKSADSKRHRRPP